MPPFDLRRYQDPLTIQRVIHAARTIAIVGLSSNHLRASYFVGFYLKRHGYRIIPVNPRETTCSARNASPAWPTSRCRWTSSTSFAPPTPCRRLRGRRWPSAPVRLWCQFTVINEEGAGIAEAGGLDVIMDRCIKVEHARYVGRMHWLGFNTHRITSVRGGLQ